MIKIDRKSSIYRLAYYGSKAEHTNVPDNLCPFMRHVLYGIWWSLICVIAAVILAIAVLSPIAMLILSLVTREEFIFYDIMALGFVIYGLIAIILFFAGYFYVKEESNLTKNIETFINKRSTLLAIKGYIKAIHDKTCPKIGFK